MRSMQALRTSSGWRISVFGAAITRVITLPSPRLMSDLRDIQALLDGQSADAQRVGDRGRTVWRALRIASGAALAIGATVPWMWSSSASRVASYVGLAGSAGTALLEYRARRLAGFSGYYQHLWVGAALASASGLANGEGKRLRDGMTDAARLYYGGLYAIAAGSKLVRSGTRWVSEPTTLRHADLTYGPTTTTPLDKSALQLGATLTLLVEGVALPSFLLPTSARRKMGLLLLTFHLVLWLRLRISFWHLSLPTALLMIAGSE